MKAFNSLQPRQNRHVIPTISFLLVLAAASMAGNPPEWPSWRGPGGTGSIGTGKYPIQWDATNVLWKVPLPGKGGSTPIVQDQRIYLTGPSEGQDAVLAFDFSGRRLWQTKLGVESQPTHRTLGSSANASPVTDGNGLFVYFRSGNLAAREDGVVFTARVGERFEMLGENLMGERIVASPVPVADRLLLRGDRHLFCVAGK